MSAFTNITNATPVLVFMTELRIDTSNIPKFEALSPNADQSVFGSFCLDADPTLSMPTTGSGPGPGPIQIACH